MLLSKCDKRLQGRVVEGHIRRREYGLCMSERKGL